MFDPLIAVAGFAVGLLVGFSGMGGGALMTPLLIFAFGVPPGTAVATDLFKAVVTKGAGAVQHFRQGTVDWKMVILLGRGSLPGALLGGAVLYGVGRLGSSHAVDRFLLPVLGVALILAAAAMFTGKRWSRAPTPGFVHDLRSPWRRRAVVLAGFLIGFLVALTSVGAGSLVMALLGVFRLVPGRKLVGTDLAHAVVLVAVATLAAHAWAGRIDFGLAANVLAGSVPGAVLGGRLSAITPVPVLRPILAVLLAVAGFGFFL